MPQLIPKTRNETTKTSTSFLSMCSTVNKTTAWKVNIHMGTKFGSATDLADVGVGKMEFHTNVCKSTDVHRYSVGVKSRQKQKQRYYSKFTNRSSDYSLFNRVTKPFKIQFCSTLTE